MMLSETQFRWKYILNREELLVLKGKRKMTEKIFETIALKAMGAGVGDSFSEFLIYYQEFLPGFSKKYENVRMDYIIADVEEQLKIDEAWEEYREKNYPDPYIEDWCESCLYYKFWKADIKNDRAESAKQCADFKRRVDQWEELRKKDYRRE